jgi:hypothetical protein
MMTRMSSRSLATVIALVTLVAGWAGAQPEPYLHPDGTIHYYDALPVPAGLGWQTAFDSALGHGGYLAAISSAEENAFIFGLIDSSNFWYSRPGTGLMAGPWLGGAQTYGSAEPDSGWNWVSGEPFNYTNWTVGQPDNAGGNEGALHFGEEVGTRVPTWDDASDLDDSIRGFVRELSAESTTVGLLLNDSSTFEGYNMFANNGGRGIYLIDNKGRLVHSWRTSVKTVGALYLLEDGHVSQIGNLGNPNFQNGGRVSLLDWDGNAVWSYDYSDSFHLLHHDAIWLPNGHMVAIAWELKNRDEAVAAGRDTTKITQNKLWSEELIEVDPVTDSIVWEWHLWDHVVQDYDSTKTNYGAVDDHAELADLNWTTTAAPNPADWIHANALDYNPQFDQIMLSARAFSEVWMIDHGTTTGEAAGHAGGRYGKGGDILYRWGNPQTYRRGDSTNQILWFQHNTSWIKPGLPGAGHITAFNNGYLRPGQDYSTAEEFVPACDSNGVYGDPPPGEPYGPAASCWSYSATPPDSFFAQTVSSVQRLPDGHTLICEGGRGRFYEVNPDSQIVWSYVSPVLDTVPLYQADSVPRTTRYDWSNIVHRCTRYAPDYPGLAGHTLTPGYPLERYRSPQQVAIAETSPAPTAREVVLRACPNPFSAQTQIRCASSLAAGAGLSVYSTDGRLVRRLAAGPATITWDGRDESGRPVGRGIYCCRLVGGGASRTLKLVKTD